MERILQKTIKNKKMTTIKTNKQNLDVILAALKLYRSYLKNSLIDEPKQREYIEDELYIIEDLIEDLKL